MYIYPFQKYSIIGKGNYSVVVQPVIEEECLDKWFIKYENAENSDVSKIFIGTDGDDYYAELDILEIISKIKNYTDFTVPIKGASFFSRKKIENDTAIMKLIRTQEGACHSNIDMQHIVFGFGGVPLNKICDRFSFNQSVKLLLQFYKGIKKIHSVNIVHRDIKPTNVLYQKNKISIIDFGMTCKVEDVFDYSKSFYTLEKIYPFNPPEFYIFHLFKKYDIRTHESVDSLFCKAFDERSSFFKEMNTFYKRHWFNFNPNTKYNVQDYIDGLWDINRGLKCCKNVDDYFTDSIAFKADIYASSYIIASIWVQTVLNTPEEEMFFKKLYEMTSKFDPIERNDVQGILYYLQNT